MSGMSKPRCLSMGGSVYGVCPKRGGEGVLYRCGNGSIQYMSWHPTDKSMPEVLKAAWCGVVVRGREASEGVSRGGGKYAV